MYERWPLEELLHGVVVREREDMLTQYRFEVLRWSVLAPHQSPVPQPPEMPRILTGE